MVKLTQVSTPEQVEWLRVQRNRPELYKYFRQDKPIKPEEQRLWWKNSPKNRIRLFIVSASDKSGKDTRVGYIGFNPLDSYAAKAEFGMFILPEEQGKGYGIEALRELLHIGFEEMSLRTIYSDCLEYEGEERFAFYKRAGFIAYPDNNQGIRYKKQGVWVPSVKFYMTKDMWESANGSNRKGELGHLQKEPFGAPPAKAGKGHRIHSSASNLNAAAG